jgi:transcription antitermination factor NusG
MGAVQVTTNLIGADDYPGLPAGYSEPRWYAAYTSAHHEMRVAQQLTQRSVENFLPLYSSVRRWKDRRVTLQLPLFPGYIFMRMALRDRMKVVQIPGVARLVGFNGSPAALQEEEIVTLKRGLESIAHAEPHPYLTVGRRVCIKHGPLAGLEGILLRWKGSWRVVISLHLIQRSVRVDIDASDIEPGIGGRGSLL